MEHVINLDDKQSRGPHLVLLFIDRNISVYFDSFGIKYIPQEVLSKIEDKSIIHNIFKIHSNDSIMFGLCGNYFIAFIEYLIARTVSLDYTSLFSPYDYQMNDKIICKYVKDKHCNIKRKP